MTPKEVTDAVVQLMEIIPAYVSCLWPFFIFLVLALFREPICGVLSLLSQRVKTAEVPGVNFAFWEQVSEGLTQTAEANQEPEDRQPHVEAAGSIIRRLHLSVCSYLFEVANKDVPLRTHLEILSRELEREAPAGIGMPGPDVAFGLMIGLAYLNGIVFKAVIKGDVLAISISPDALQRIVERLHPELADRPSANDDYQEGEAVVSSGRELVSTS